MLWVLYVYVCEHTPLSFPFPMRLCVLALAHSIKPAASPSRSAFSVISAEAQTKRSTKLCWEDEQQTLMLQVISFFKQELFFQPQLYQDRRARLNSYTDLHLFHFWFIKLLLFRDFLQYTKALHAKDPDFTGRRRDGTRRDLNELWILFVMTKHGEDICLRLCTLIPVWNLAYLTKQ